MAVQTQYRFVIPGYSAPTPNALFRSTLRRRMQLEREAKELVWHYGRDIPPATCRRRVSLVITLGPRQRRPDVDAVPWKCLLDALAAHGLIQGDRHTQCALGAVEYRRGPGRAVEVVLEDVE